MIGRTLEILTMGKAQERYGDGYGREVLTARRLVEAGISFVTVRAPGTPRLWLATCTSINHLKRHGFAVGFEFGLRRLPYENRIGVLIRPQFHHVALEGEGAG